MVIIKTVKIYDYEHFACIISDTYDDVTSDDEFNSVGVVAKYEDAKEIIRELIGLGHDIANIKINDSQCNGYDDAYIVSLDDEGIWCEPIKRDSGYIYVENQVCYIFGNCNSKILEKIESDKIYEVKFYDEDEDEDDCECCDCANCKPSTSTASYSVNGKPVGKEEYENAMAEIDKKYQEFRDEFAELMRLFW